MPEYKKPSHGAYTVPIKKLSNFSAVCLFHYTNKIIEYVLNPLIPVSSSLVMILIEKVVHIWISYGTLLYKIKYLLKGNL